MHALSVETITRFSGSVVGFLKMAARRPLRIVALVNAGMDHFAVARTDPRSDQAFAFDDKDLASRPRRRPGDCEPDDATTEDGHSTKLVCGRTGGLPLDGKVSRASLQAVSASIAQFFDRPHHRSRANPIVNRTRKGSRRILLNVKVRSGIPSFAPFAKN